MFNDSASVTLSVDSVDATMPLVPCLCGSKAEIKFD